MIIVVRGNTEYGDSSTKGEYINVESFTPTSVEVYEGKKGQETLQMILGVNSDGYRFPQRKWWWKWRKK